MTNSPTSDAQPDFTTKLFDTPLGYMHSEQTKTEEGYEVKLTLPNLTKIGGQLVQIVHANQIEK